jgi:hypothetical protein
MARNNKNYSSVTEMTDHFSQWNEADSIIAEINKKAEISGKGAKVGHNVTSDMTPQ